MRGVWRDGNRFALLPESACFLPAMTEAIAAARHSIILELYLMESGRLANQLIDEDGCSRREELMKKIK